MPSPPCRNASYLHLLVTASEMLLGLLCTVPPEVASRHRLKGKNKSPIVDGKHEQNSKLSAPNRKNKLLQTCFWKRRTFPCVQRRTSNYGNESFQTNWQRRSKLPTASTGIVDFYTQGIPIFHTSSHSNLMGSRIPIPSHS
eukprot:c28160_g2_i1 orf=222-644(+)